jgi:hypothetical protein
MKRSNFLECTDFERYARFVAREVLENGGSETSFFSGNGLEISLPAGVNE